MALRGHTVLISKKVDDFSMAYPKYARELPDRLRALGAEVVFGIDVDKHVTGPTVHHILPAFETEEYSMLRAASCHVVGMHCVLSHLSNRQLEKAFPVGCDGPCCVCMAGVTVSAAGFDTAQKSEIQRRVEWMGGAFHARPTPNCDFLVAASVDLEVYQQAVQMEKIVVGVEWVRSCWAQHCLVGVGDHCLPPFTGLKVCTTGFNAIGQRFEVEECISAGGGEYQADMVKGLTTHLVAQSSRGEKYEMAAAWGIQVVNPEWLQKSAAQKKRLPEKHFPVPPPTHSSPTFIQASPLPSRGHLSGLTVDVDGELEHYLSACHIWVVGFGAAEGKVAVRMVRLGGGARSLTYNYNCTHVIVGAQPPTISHPQLRHLASEGSCHVVWPSWLEECTREKRQVAVTDAHLVSLKDLHGFRVPNPRPTPTPTSHPIPIPAPSSEPNGARKPPYFFAGCSFRFSPAVPPKERKATTALIIRARGNVQGEGVLDPPRYFVGAHGEGGMLREGHLVTPDWVRVCSREGYRLPRDDFVLFRPLRGPLPLRGFASVHLYVTQVGDPKRSMLRLLCERLGGVALERVGRKMTHLLCLQRGGDKEQVAAERGMSVSVVTEEWLLGCAKKGERQEEALYPAPQPQAGEEIAASQNPEPWLTQPPTRKREREGEELLDLLVPPVKKEEVVKKEAKEEEGGGGGGGKAGIGAIIDEYLDACEAAEAAARPPPSPTKEVKEAMSPLVAREERRRPLRENPKAEDESDTWQRPKASSGLDPDLGLTKGGPFFPDGEIGSQQPTQSVVYDENYYDPSHAAKWQQREEEEE